MEDMSTLIFIDLKLIKAVDKWRSIPYCTCVQFLGNMKMKITKQALILIINMINFHFQKSVVTVDENWLKNKL